MRRILIENSVIEPKKCSYGFPWKSDAICYNFRMPEECISAADIDKINDKDDIETLVIGCNLDSYDFISDMINLKQLYIYSGDNVRNLNFTEKLVNLQQLYIADTHISDLSPLYSLVKEKEQLMRNESDAMRKLDYLVEGICIKTDCEINDAYTLLDAGIYISELIIGTKRIKRRRITE